MRRDKRYEKDMEDHDLMYDLLFFCAGCSNDDEMISEDHPKPTTEKKRTEIIKQKTTQKRE